MTDPHPATGVCAAAVPPPAPRGAGGGLLAALVLALSACVTGVFCVSFWGRNAAGLGRGDMGLALLFSFAVPLAFYASLAAAALALVGLAAAWRRARPKRLWLAALALASLPAVFLALVDLF